MSDTAIIIAGGKGTRMHPVTGDRLPKALLPIAGRAVIVRQLDLLQRFGFRRCFITAGHLAEELQEALGDHHEDVAIEYVLEDKPLGTAGALVGALLQRLTDDFVVLYGDVAAWFDLDNFVAAHRRYRSDATLVVHPNDHPFDSDFVQTDEHGIITRLLPKKTRPPGDYNNLVSAAAYCMSPASLQHVQPDTKQDFVVDVFPRMLLAGQRLVAYSTTEYLKDTGTPKRIEEVDAAYRAGRHQKWFRGAPRPAVFLDRDGVINVERDHLSSADDFALIEGSAEAIRQLNKAGLLVVVVTNQPGLAKGFFGKEDLAAIHRRMETALGDAGAYVHAIYHCPHHPERGFDGEVPSLKLRCGCRKPEPGMLYRAAADLGIDLSQSVMVGDSWRDMHAAAAAGVLPLGVRTGHACRQTSGGRPELAIFDDLAQVADWLTASDAACDAWLERIIGNMREGRRSLILIGGISRAGKSSLAARLVHGLRQCGKRGLRVALDEWIAPLDAREGLSRAQHFGLEAASEALRQLLEGKPMVSPGYNPATRNHDAARCYDPYEADVIIADGVMALSPLIDCAALRIFVEANEGEVASRFLRYYQWKGLRGGRDPVAAGATPRFGVAGRQTQQGGGGRGLDQSLRDQIMIIAGAPFRISFGGGGSDVASYYEKRRGAVLSTTIDKSMYITIHRYFEPKQTLLKYSQTELVERIGDIQHPIFREVLQRMLPGGGIEVSSSADIPAGTGLGSSSSFTVALLHALHAHQGRFRSKEQLADGACKVEIDYLGEPIGKQDQYAAAYGGLNLIEFQSNGQVAVSPVTLPADVATELQDNLLLFFTGLQRSARDILSEQKRNMSEQEKVDTLTKMVDLTYQMLELLMQGDVSGFGRAMHQQWLHKRSLASGISNPIIAKYYDIAMRHGALGGKLLGAGGGGFLLFYCEPEQQQRLREAMSDLRELPFRFDWHGSRILYVGDRR